MITDSLGAYQSRSLAPGTYIVVASAQGFASSSSQAVTLASGQSVQYSVALQIQVEQQDIQVDADAPTVDTDPDKNANAIVLKGKDLDALSDDPDELQNELQPLAGPSTGPNGGQSYVDGILAGTYPATPIAVPAENNMQYQSGGVYRQNQIIASLTARYSRFSLTSVYTFNGAKADTSAVTYTPSIATDPGFDYGRAGFDIHNRFVLLADITAPWQLSFSPFLSANSGTPYNITTGSDLTGNNQFNARPTFAAGCDQPGAVPTPYGCLDPDPLSSASGAREKIVPHNLGAGPSNVSLNLRVSKTFGFGPRTAGEGGSPGAGQVRGRSGGSGGGLGGQGLSGNQSGPMRPGVSSSHKYGLTFSAYGQNILNHENLGTPNGTLSSPLFGKSQSLAGGFFGPSTAGNRSIFFATDFHF
jgi:hypothetical protein